MDINDYLIDQAGKDWTALLRKWMPPLPPSFTLWLVNRFGDVFAVLDDGPVHMLDLGNGTFSKVADSREQFIGQIDVAENANNWLLIPLVDQCRKAGLTLAPHQCYGFKVPPRFGGKYTLSNVEPIDINVHFSVLADVHQKTKDVSNPPTERKVTIE